MCSEKQPLTAALINAIINCLEMFMLNRDLDFFVQSTINEGNWNVFFRSVQEF